ncbi:MAG: hypothetical protein LH613_04555 [Chamaesiphon sp.]|nr:hypothetical protein [Chamaesiphon sp.]
MPDRVFYMFDSLPHGKPRSHSRQGVWLQRLSRLIINGGDDEILGIFTRSGHHRSIVI